MKNEKLTIILPCAGNGTRLAIPFPKEMMPIGPNFVLIDFIFSYFKKCKRDEVEFIITINPNKMDLVKYLHRYTHNFDIKFIYFNENYSEFPGSIRSASSLIGDKNIILLPDSIIRYSFPSLYESVLASFENNDQFFIATRCEEPLFLASKGCLQINEYNQLISYQDKPRQVDKFNSIWTGICFSKDKFQSTLSVIETATFKQDEADVVFKSSNFYNSNSLLVDDYKDLGTWPDLIKYYK